MFRRHARPRPGLAAPASWQGLVHLLATECGSQPQECPALCRRKGDHAHLRHDAAAADVTVFPVVVERCGP